MFGYVIVNKGDLTFREFDVYHSYYCGLCKTLKEKYGVLGQLALNYDMTFLVMLLSSLYEPQTDYTREGCVTHLFMKQGISKNEITQFGADMTILLTAYKCEDDWQDEKKFSRKLYESALHGRMSKVKEKYRDKAEIIEVCFANLHRLEQENCDKPDKMAAIFGKVMEELFVYREDEWEETLRSMGFYLGKYIYLLDAYEDLEKDKKQKNYNPFSTRAELPDFEEECRIVLTSAISECTRAFEMLPLIDNVKILRNILYSGVWYKYGKVKEERSRKNTMPEDEKNGSI